MFCNECGARVEAAPEAPVTPVAPAEPQIEAYYSQETTVLDPSMLETPAVEPYAPAEQTYNYADQSAFAQPQFDAPAKKPKKKTFLGIIAAVLVLAIVAGVAAFFTPVKGLIVKTFGSEQDYFLYVEDKSSEVIITEVSGSYGAALEVMDVATGGAEVGLKLNVGDKLINLLEENVAPMLGTEFDLAWLDTIQLKLGANSKDSLSQLVGALMVKGETFVDLDVIMDSAEGEIFLGVLSLSEKYLKGNLELDAQYTQMTDILSDPDLKKALPTEEEFGKLLDKYWGIVLENLNDIKKEDAVLEAAGIEQKVTALKIEIEQEDALNIAKALLKAVKEDEQIEKHLKDILGYFAEKEMLEDADSIREEFYASIDEALENVENPEEIEDSEAIILTNYVDARHEVIGRKLEMEGKEAASYAVVRNGKAVGYELKVMDELLVTGEGTEEGDKLDAQYKVSIAGKTLCDIVVSDLKTTDETANGKIRIVPSAELIEEMGLNGEVAALLSIANPELEIALAIQKDSGEVSFNVISGNEVYVGFTVSAKETASANIQKPSEDKVYEEDQANEWLSSLDLAGLLEKVEGLGIPSELLESIFSGSSGDDYDYDYDYGYEDDTDDAFGFGGF